MKIHIVFPGPLFPLAGMSQVRMLNQLKGLSADHELVFSDILAKSGGQKQTMQTMSDLGVEYHPLLSASYGKGRLVKAARVLALKLGTLLTPISKEEFSVSSRQIKNQLLDLVGNLRPDAFLIHYWYLGFLFKQVDKDILKIIDTHYLVEEHMELLKAGKYAEGRIASLHHKIQLEHSLDRQRRCFLASDLVIVNSEKQASLINSWEPKVPVSVTVNGQDLGPYLSYRNEHRRETAVLFYGSLGNQFNRRALKRILTSILPMIRESIPECTLYIVGANPPLEIIENVKDESVIVTGYVDDIKPYLTRCRVMLLPLETGSGFRGRVVELLALGIPIVGTWNGLQSVGFLDGEHGFLAETDADTAQRAIELLHDTKLWVRISNNCRLFARKAFSLENTYGRLSATISALRDSSTQNNITEHAGF